MGHFGEEGFEGFGGFDHASRRLERFAGVLPITLGKSLVTASQQRLNFLGVHDMQPVLGSLTLAKVAVKGAWFKWRSRP